MRKVKVLLRINGVATIIDAAVVKQTIEINPDSNKHVMCGFVRRGGKRIRVHVARVDSVIMWVSTWDFAGFEFNVKTQ